MTQGKCLLLHIPKLHILEDGASSSINFIAMGIYSLCHQLVINGFDAEVLHLSVEKYLDKNFSAAKYVKDNNIKFIALSLHWHPQSYDVIEIAKSIKKENPDVFISLGGFTASYFAKEILEKFSFIDAIIKGEGEIPIAELAQNAFAQKTDFSKIPNLCWRNGKEIVINTKKYVASDEDLDKFNFVGFDYLKHFDSYFKTGYMLNLFEEGELTGSSTIHGVCIGRGCYGNCSWCGGGFKNVAKITGRNRISRRSAKSIVKDMKVLKQKFDVKNFHFAFDPTPFNQEKQIELFNYLAENFDEKLNITFECFGLPQKDFIKTFKESCASNSSLLISPEFEDEHLRKKHKTFYYSNQELEDTLEYMNELKVMCDLSFADIPNLSDEQRNASVEYGEYLTDKYPNSVNGFSMGKIILEPGSKWFDEPELCGGSPERKCFEDFYNDNRSIELSFDALDLEKEKR